MTVKDDLNEETDLEMDSNEELDTPEKDAPEEVVEGGSLDDDSGEMETEDSTDDDEEDDSESKDDTPEDQTDNSLASEQAEDRQKVDYEARYKGSQRSWQKEREQRIAAERRAAEYEQRLREQEEARQAKETENLEPWNPRSPQHQSFNKTLEKYDLFKQALERAPDEESRQAVASAFQPMFSEQEIEAMKQHQIHLANVQRKLATPEGQMEYIGSLVERKLQEQLESRKTQEQQAQEFEKMRQYYADLYAQPENKAVLENQELREEFARRLQAMGDNPPQDAVEIVLENLRYRSQSGELPSKLAKAKQAEMSAREQKRLAKGRAKTERDQGLTTRAVDPVAEAKRICAQRGIEWGSNKAFQVLDELTEHQ